MLLELHNTIQHLLYQRGGIDAREVDITFEAPTRELLDRLTRPAINVFFFDLQENADLRQHNFQTTRNNGNGKAERRLAPKRFDLRYMVSALTTSIEDEHELLWRALLTLARHPQFPPELLPSPLRSLEPPLITTISQADDSQRLTALWSSLGVPPHPALYYVVTVPVEMNLVIESPLVLTRTTRYVRSQITGVAPEIRNQIGGVVRNARGEPLAGVTVAHNGISGSVTNNEGRYILPDVPTGAVTLRVTHEDGSREAVTVQVPASQSAASSQKQQLSYDIVLEAAAPSGNAASGNNEGGLS